MGRAERRYQERMKERRRHENIKFLTAVANANANQKKLVDSKIDELESMVTNANVSCIFAATAYEIRKRFNTSPEETLDILQAIDDDIGVIGTDECPTIRDFKIQYALKTGMNICLDESEAEEVERKYEEAEKKGELEDHA